MCTDRNRSASAVVASLVMACVLFAGCADDGKDSHLEAGMRHLRARQFDAAAKALERAARKHPESATAHCNLGIAYWEMGSVTRALASLRRAADLAQDDPRPLEFLGQIFTRLERWDEARRTLNDAQELDPDAVRILVARAVVEFRDGEAARAQELLAHALTIEPDYPPALYNMGQIQRYLPDGKVAAKAYFERYLGAVSHQDDHTVEAQSFLDHLADSDPGGGVTTRPAGALLEKARAALAARNTNAAEAALLAAVQADPGSSEAAWEYASFLDEQRRDGTEAARLFADFAARFPTDPRAAEARKRADDLAALASVPALATVVGALGNDPAKAADLYAAALEKHRQSDWQGAADLYRQALSYDKGQLYAALNLGQVCKADGNLRGAVEAFEYALTLNPGMAEAGYQLASALQARGMIPDAIAQAEAVANSHPDHPRTQHLLGLLYLSANRTAEARERFERYIQLAPDEPLAKRTREWLDAQ